MKTTALKLILLCTTLLLAGCTNSTKTYRIGVSQCAAGQWREKVNREMLAAQHLYECDVAVTICDAQDSPERQIAQIDSLTEAGIDLLVVAPTESAPIAEAVARTRARGIPVIFFDRRAATEDYTAFIGGNNREAGLTMGQYALTLASAMAGTGRKPRILEVTGAMTTSPASERHEGFAQAMQSQQAADYVCLKSDWSAASSRQAVAGQMAKGWQPDIVFCHNDAMCMGAYEALSEAHQADRVSILGIDGMPDEGISYVRQGKLAGTYIYPTQGHDIVRLAIDILTGRPYQRDNYVSSMVVTPQNVEIISLNSQELIRQNDDLITIQDKLEAYFGLYSTQQKMLWASLVLILLLAVAVATIGRAFLQMRRNIRQRQAMNEEQTLFYTNPDSRKLQQAFAAPMDELPAPRSQDAIFAEQLNEAIRQQMSNPALKMDDLGKSVGLSRVQLYRKVKAITGLSPIELLRQIRLQQGYVLLSTTTKTVQEIAYEVGFGTPGYFSKCFKQQYGKYPTDLRAE